jgi:hypothetical protein
MLIYNPHQIPQSASLSKTQHHTSLNTIKKLAINGIKRAHLQLQNRILYPLLRLPFSHLHQKNDHLRPKSTTYYFLLGLLKKK